MTWVKSSVVHLKTPRPERFVPEQHKFSHSQSSSSFPRSYSLKSQIRQKLFSMLPWWLTFWSMVGLYGTPPLISGLASPSPPHLTPTCRFNSQGSSFLPPPLPWCPIHPQDPSFLFSFWIYLRLATHSTRGKEPQVLIPLPHIVFITPLIIRFLISKKKFYPLIIWVKVS